MKLQQLKIKTKEDLTNAVNEFGFLPFFQNSIKGFSIEEHIDLDCWYDPATGSWPVWEWKGPVIRESGCAFGKFFEKKACYISPEWFSDFANYRRDGYDFDARFDDGLAPFRDKELYDLIDRNAPILSKKLKEIGNYRKGGNKGFDTIITRLQAQGYVLISDFVYMKDRNGFPYGWGVAEYSTPERMMGDAFREQVYRRLPEASYERLLRHFERLLPNAGLDTIKKFIR